MQILSETPSKNGKWRDRGNILSLSSLSRPTVSGYKDGEELLQLISYAVRSSI